MAARKAPKTPAVAQRVDPEKLRLLREARGITQESLAARSGFGLRTIRDIEAGRSNPNPSTLKVLLDALGSTLAEVRPDTAPRLPAPAPVETRAPLFDPAPSRLEHLINLTNGKPDPAPRATPSGLVPCLTPRAFQQVFTGYRIREGARFVIEGIVEQHRGLTTVEARALGVKRGLGARFLFAQTVEGAPFKVTAHVADRTITEALFDRQGKKAAVVARVTVVETPGEDGETKGTFDFFGGASTHDWGFVVEALL